jgi:hypothetical protein
MGRVWLLAAWAILAPGVAWAQSDATGYAPPEPNLPLPLGSTQPGAGGLYFSSDYVMYRYSNPLQNQAVAVRGFQVTDPIIGMPVGTFVGSRADALDVHQLSGPNGYQPGFRSTLGYKFEDESALEVSFMWISTNQQRATATLAPRDLALRDDFANSFLFSPVYNFPNEYAGPIDKVAFTTPTLATQTFSPTINTTPTLIKPDATGTTTVTATIPPLTLPAALVTPVNAAYGIWNAASVMSMKFEQRAEEIGATYRVPVYDCECYRLSGLVGPRFFWLWDRFQWRTEDDDEFGNTLPNWVAIYTNIVSNRMYGAHAGCRQEWYLGHGFACTLDTEVAGYMDSALERAKYELGTKDAGPQNKRSLRDIKFVPEVQGTFSVNWFPTEGIEMSFGYDVMVFFNTVAAPQPVDFNYSSVYPNYVSQTRILDGIVASITIYF